jgi:hypothetical protein
MSNRAEGVHAHLVTRALHNWVCRYEVDEGEGEIRYLAAIARRSGVGLPVQEELVQLFDPSKQAPEDALVDSINSLIDSTDFASV